jgi:hypothetical protein
MNLAGMRRAKWAKSTNSVARKASSQVRPRLFGQSQRNRPKSLEDACAVALRVVESAFLVHFTLCIPAKFTVGALLESLFGQFRKTNSRKFEQ